MSESLEIINDEVRKRTGEQRNEFHSITSEKQKWISRPGNTDISLVDSSSKPSDSQLKDEIKRLLLQRNAVLVSHYYVSKELQILAEETGGCVADSLEMARFGKTHPAAEIFVAGVKFMGETAKILTPNKRVYMPTLEATCSLDLGCPVDEFSAFCDQYPDHQVVVYANTSAAVKARADWVVTSSIALDVVDYLHSQGESIVWGPDKHLGAYVQRKTGADMVIWDAACIVHDEFKAKGIQDLKRVYPEAGVLVHPESPEAVIELADFVGSTSQIIQAAKTLGHPTFIVATDKGIFYKLQQAAPEKLFIEAPTAGHGATCKSCAHCPWMAMNDLETLAYALKNRVNEVIVEPRLIPLAQQSLQKMLSFRA